MWKKSKSKNDQNRINWKNIRTKEILLFFFKKILKFNMIK